MKKLSLSIVICAAVISLAGISQACCIYNNSSYPLQVDWSLINEWIISPSNHRCTNGTGGHVNISLLDGLRKKELTNVKGVDIDDHGWLSVYKKENNRWKAVSKHKDGSVKSTTYLYPVD